MNILTVKIIKNLFEFNEEFSNAIKNDDTIKMQLVLSELGYRNDFEYSDYIINFCVTFL